MHLAAGDARSPLRPDRRWRDRPGHRSPVHRRPDRPDGRRPRRAAVPPAAAGRDRACRSTPGAGPGVPGGGPGLLVRTDAPPTAASAGAPVRIGREPGLEVVIDDPAVSRQHALVEPRPTAGGSSTAPTSARSSSGERVTQLQARGARPTGAARPPDRGLRARAGPGGRGRASAAKGSPGKKRRKTLAVVGRRGGRAPRGRRRRHRRRRTARRRRRRRRPRSPPSGGEGAHRGRARPRQGRRPC